MKDDLIHFIKVLKLIQTPGEGPCEAHFGVLDELAKNSPEIVKWVKNQFHSNSDEFDKSNLAMVAVEVGLRDEFEKYLREFDGWTDEDFEDD